MSDDVRIAYQRAVDRVGEALWPYMSVHDQAAAIYKELRALDADRVAQRQIVQPATE